MKKMSVVVVLLLIVCFSMNAKILSPPFEPKEFDVDIFQYPYMIQIENMKSDQIDTYYDFTNDKKEYEIRYSFFKETAGADENIKTAFISYIYAIVNNVAGFDVPFNQISSFNDSDVKNEFNGDFGVTVFLQNPQSDFGENYPYLMINFYYKKGQGIVAQSLLFKNIELTKTQEFMEIFHSYKFHE